MLEMKGDLQEKRRAWLRYAAVCALCLLFFAFFLLLGHMSYETNDDETMSLICAGAYGPGVHLVYSHYLLGLVLSRLYLLFPGLNWYLVLLLSANLTAITAVCLVFGSRLNLPGSMLLTAGLNALLGYDFYNNLQFSKNAALLTGTGAVLLLYLFYGGKKKKTAFFLGSFLTAAGFMVRKDSFYAAAVIMACGALPALQWKKREMIRRLLCVFGPALLAVLICMGINKAAYGNDPMWRDYMKYNMLRSELLDYGFPSYKVHKEEIEALGLDKNDLKLLQNWDYMDPEVFTLEKLEKLVEMRGGSKKTRLKINRSTLLRAAKGVGEAVTSYGFAGICAGIMIALLLAGTAAQNFTLLAALLIICLEYWYLGCFGRVIWRGECGIWLSALLVSLSAVFFAGDLPERFRRAVHPERHRGWSLWIGTVMAAGIAAGSLLYTFFVEKGQQVFDHATSYQALVEEINRRGDEGDPTIYVADTFTFSFRPVVSRMPDITGKLKGWYRNMGFIGGWMGASPDGQYYLKKQGIENPIRSLAEDERTVFLCGEDTSKIMLKYLRKHCSEDIQRTLVEEIDGYKIWSYHERTENNKDE